MKNLEKNHILKRIALDVERFEIPNKFNKATTNFIKNNWEYLKNELKEFIDDDEEFLSMTPEELFNDFNIQELFSLRIDEDDRIFDEYEKVGLDLDSEAVLLHYTESLEPQKELLKKLIQEVLNEIKNK